MANARFDGTLEFKEHERERHAHFPVSFREDLYFLTITIEGKISFDVMGLKGEVPITYHETFMGHHTKRDMQRLAVKKYEEGAVDKMMKRIIINAIKNFRYNQECDLAEDQYKALISNVKKYGIEMTLKPRDFEER